MLHKRHGNDWVYPQRQMRGCDDDAGSHHICIDLTSTSTNFCQATGQPNWCAQEGQCMGKKGKCPRKNWCVCQWAFTGYIHAAGGCDKIAHIKCDAINMAALVAYKKGAKEGAVVDGGKICHPLACLCKRCNLKDKACSAPA